VEVRLVDGGSDEAWEAADRLAESDTSRYYRIHQYKSEFNALAHYETTGPEIWDQAGGRIDYAIVTLGTTGTIVGAGRYLKERDPAIRVIAAEPLQENKQMGLRNLKKQRVPFIWDPSIVDETISVPDEPAFNLTRDLAKQEGIFCGISSGSCMYAAMEIAKRIEKGVIVAVLPDRGDRYLSTELWRSR
jgi:cysteine synthase B